MYTHDYHLKPGDSHPTMAMAWQTCSIWVSVEDVMMWAWSVPGGTHGQPIDGWTGTSSPKPWGFSHEKNGGAFRPFRCQLSFPFNPIR